MISGETRACVGIKKKILKELEIFLEIWKAAHMSKAVCMPRKDLRKREGPGPSHSSLADFWDLEQTGSKKIIIMAESKMNSNTYCWQEH